MSRLRHIASTILATVLLTLAAPPAWAAAQASATPPAQAALPEFYIREYRVLGAHHLQPVEIEAAVYPFLGPGRTVEDVEGARAALAKVYEDKNYTSVDVVIPPQKGAGGIVYLQVNELPVGRLRVEGSRYYDINNIKHEAPSLAEGKLINFTQAQEDLVGLNQLPDRRVTPEIKSGTEPETMDVDLNVKDTLPLHGSIELNNRYSLGTPTLRLNGSVSYDNLWQLGHSIGGSIQVSPQNYNKVDIYSGFYTMRFPTADWLSITLQGIDQGSNVSTLGGTDSIGRGDIVGTRINFKLPTIGDYFHTFTLGIDYKDFKQDSSIGVIDYKDFKQDSSIGVTPGESPAAIAALESEFDFRTIYVPITLDYAGTWAAKNYLTDLDISAVFGIRGIGSSETELNSVARFGASGNFFYLHGSLSHTQDLPLDTQLYAKVSGQVSDSPLVSSEELSAGGEDTVRGYLESAVQGDNGVIFNAEFRSPSVLQWFPRMNDGKPGNEWRFYVFTDAATVTVIDPLPDQTQRFSIASFGAGTRMTIFNHLNGSFDLAIPLFDQAELGTAGATTYITKAHYPFLCFRVWADF